MPNFTINQLTITGKKSDIKLCINSIRNDAEQTDFDFNKIVPEPNNLSEDWHSWRIDNWGTKSNAGAVSGIWDEDGSYTIIFETAWSAPSPIIKELAVKYPNLTFELQAIEPNMEIAWEVKCKANQSVINEWKAPSTKYAEIYDCILGGEVDDE